MNKIRYGFGCLNNTTKNGKLAIMTNDPNDTYLLKLITQIHTEIAINAGIGINAKATPQLVAIPLPPLNLKKTVQICPKTAKAAKYTLNTYRLICNWLL